jgi:hypothetical protein
MNLADANLAAQLPAKRKLTPAEDALKNDVFNAALIGLIIRGEFNWENQNPCLLRCWKVADKAVEARERV